MEDSPSKLNFVEQLKPYVADDDTYGRLYADFHDLLEACEWFLSAVKKNEGKSLKPAELEDFLIEIDINFIQHVTYHLNSVRDDLKRTLENFPNDEQE